LEQVVGEYESSLGNERVEVIPIGRKMEQACRKLRHEPAEDLSRLIEHPDYASASSLASGLMQRFEHGDIDRVELLYQHFKSTSTQVLTRETLLPFPFDENNGENGSKQGKDEIDYIIEPSREELLTRLLPKAVRLKLFTSLLDSRAAEQAARLLAMQVATDNADDLLSQLNIDYNEQRQESITNELLDIIGGSFK
jgi:F-type H+-transporting ATPase subunit gamma